MKIAVITDTHFGCRNDNQQISAYISRFYHEVFFPYLDKHGIKTLIHCGDIVDRRKYINFLSLRRLREDLINPCTERGIDAHFIIGNHDTYFKNTNEFNCMRELFGSGQVKFKWYEEATEVDFGGTPIVMMPWINMENLQHAQNVINSTRAQILFGHLEIAGFEMYRGQIVEHGFNRSMFSKFDIAASGHFHHRNKQDNIYYLGCPYEMTWSDYGDPKGFHIFDTETREFEFIENPLKLFHKLWYDDTDKGTLDEAINFTNEVANSYVKVVVRTKNNPFWFDAYIDRLEKVGLIDLKVVEDHLNLSLEDDQDIIDEAEDTISILKKYITQAQFKCDTNGLVRLTEELYNEALQMD